MQRVIHKHGLAFGKTEELRAGHDQVPLVLDGSMRAMTSRIAYFCAKHPFKLMLVQLMILIGASGICLWRSGELMDTVSEGVDWIVADSDAGRDWDTLIGINEQTTSFADTALGAGIPDTGRVTASPANSLLLVMKDNDCKENDDSDGLWTPEKAQALCKFETGILRDVDYVKHLCWRTSEGECNFSDPSWLSQTFEFYGRPWDAENNQVDWEHRFGSVRC